MKSYKMFDPFFSRQIMLGAQEKILPKQSVIPAILLEQISPVCDGKLVSNLPFLAEVKFLTCLIFFGTPAILLTVCGGESNFPYARRVIRMR